jgi:hypothetical protein
MQLEEEIKDALRGGRVEIAACCCSMVVISDPVELRSEQ